LFVFCANACAAQDDKTTQTHLVGDDTTPLDCNLAKAAAARSIEAGLEKREIRIGAGFAGLTQQPAAQ
jgi:hypothetical protein